MDARRGGRMCGDGEWTPAAAGVMDLARGRRNREVEIGKLRVEV